MWRYKIGNRTEEIIEKLDMRIFYLQELKEILYYNGFNLEPVFDDYDESPFVSASPKQLVIYRISEQNISKLVIFDTFNALAIINK